MAVTYDQIATTTFGSTTQSYTFSSIPQTYTDLVLSFNGKSDANIWNIRFNGDTASNYANSWIGANGANPYKSYDYPTNQIYPNPHAYVNMVGSGIMNIMSYTGSGQKTVLSKLSISNTSGSGGVELHNGIWFNTAAINSITVTQTNMLAGTTISLYGILRA